MVELGFLKHFHFLDEHVSEREDLVAFFGNPLLELSVDELLAQGSEGVSLSFLDHNLHHDSSDLLLLGCFGVTGSFKLSLSLLSESNRLESDEVSV